LNNTKLYTHSVYLLAVTDAPDSPFEGLFGDTSQLRLAEKLLAMPSFEFSVSELAQTAGISRPSVYNVLRAFEQWNLVTKLRRGKRVRYQLNDSSAIVGALYDLNHSLLLHMEGPIKEELSLREEAATPQVEIAYARESQGALVMIRGPVHTGKATKTVPSQIGVA